MDFCCFFVQTTFEWPWAGGVSWGKVLVFAYLYFTVGSNYIFGNFCKEVIDLDEFFAVSFISTVLDIQKSRT